MSDARERLLALRRATPLTDWEQEALNSSDMGTNADQRIQHLDALRAYDPSATLAETLSVRLVGEGQAGGLGSEEARLLEPLDQVVSDLSEDGNTHLEVVEIGQGSTILYLRPRDRGRVEIEGVPVDSSAADLACRAAIRLFQRLESGSDVGELRPGLKGAIGFVRKLSDLGLDAHVAWEAGSGVVREAALTESARNHVLRMIQTHDVEETKYVSGRITELRQSGFVKVKSGTARNSPAHEVHFDESALSEMPQTLGETVHFVVAVDRAIDGFGESVGERLRFVRHAEGDTVLLSDEAQ